MHRHRHSGMTLLEICMSLMIIGIVFGLAIPFTQEIFRPHPLETQLESFDDLVRTAIAESHTENQTARIVFTKSAIRLAGAVEEESDLSAAPDTDRTLLIPGGAKYQLQLWPDFEWVNPDDTGWDIPATGLILPLTIKWVLDDSWLAASVDPMTGAIKDVTYELN